MEMNLELCLGFSELLTYPGVQTKPVAIVCERRLKESDPDAAAAFAGFINFLDQQDLCRVEEIFTSTFDLQALSYPYIGYQLCGESQARTLFLLKLQELYIHHDFSAQAELPDHLSVVLRFIGTIPDPQGNAEIIRDGLLPALENIIQGIDTLDHPYRHLLEALRIYLTNRIETELSETERQKELSHG